jgi:hypothetical protein
MDVDAILRAHSEPQALLYAKDCYALSLLTHVIGGGRRISALRQGSFARLLDKSSVKRALAHAPNGVLEPKHLERALPTERETFPVTLGRWGTCTGRSRHPRYHQTSRPGENVVLQLNFPTLHDRAYERLVQPVHGHPFVMGSHPVRAESPFTLGWARLDFDLEADEVLIEEIQSDWVREAKYYRDHALGWLADGEPSRLPFLSDVRANPLEMLAYYERVLEPYARLWPECVLIAAIEFAYSTLGVRRVYLHTHEGGRVMKRLCGRWLPPRSLYTELPERFCFTRTRRPPRLFARDRRVREEGVQWFALDLT